MITEKHFEQLKNLLFIDIETASQAKEWEELSENMQSLWSRKGKKLSPGKSAEESYLEWAALFAEFGKIIAIGMGYFFHEDDQVHFKVKSLDYEREEDILQEIADMLANTSKLKLVSHNGISFDYPYLGRRMLVHNIPLPPTLDLMAKKPWEIKHVDTLQLWKFGEARNFTSLELLCEILDIPSSKDDLDGSLVSKVYHETGNLKRIATYSQYDVIATARVFLRMKGMPALSDECIHWVE